MLVVAHRLSTISTADRIIVIAERTKVEEGAHESLLAQRGLYWRLFASQVR
jgi:ATP-binding cassette subfamily B protein